MPTYMYRKCVYNSFYNSGIGNGDVGRKVNTMGDLDVGHLASARSQPLTQNRIGSPGEVFSTKYKYGSTPS